MMKIVTFHRSYEIDDSEIHNSLVQDGMEDVEITEEVMDCEAENIARALFWSDFEELSTNEDDFSCSIETKEN